MQARGPGRAVGALGRRGPCRGTDAGRNPGPDRPSEEELQALVDGRLDPARRDAVSAWLAEHPAESETVTHFRAQNRAIEDAFAPLLDRPVPDRLRAQCRRSA